MRKKSFRTYILSTVLLLSLASGRPALAEGPVVIKNNQSSSAEEESEETESDAYVGRLAEAKTAIREREAGRYGMVPIYPTDIADGTYEIEVDSSSSFFKITEAELTVQGESMTARITISSLSYLYVYMGTAQEAEKEETDSLIAAEEEDGKTIFTIPVEALDQEMDCAAFSKKRQRWYDRTLVFDASSLPEEALAFDLPDYELIETALLAYQADGEENAGDQDASGDVQEAPEAVEIARDDGEYSIEVNMTGGSGRASISSPTLLTVSDGRAYATLLWSSAYYDYMIIDGTCYYNQTTDGGNSTFEIPITVMDEAMPVIADTTAMGDPVEIEYELTFYSESVGAKSQIPQEAAKRVLVIAALIIVVGGILNAFLKKRQG